MTYEPFLNSERVSPSWHSPPEQLAVDDRSVHLWLAPLDISPTAIGRLFRVLSHDEITRADRFHFARDRNHFIAARAWLRIIIGCYLRIEPTELRFNYSKYGKPELAKSSANDCRLTFNLAHSGEFALYGIAIDRRIGIDLEDIRTEFDFEDLASRFFSKADVARLLSVPAAAQLKAFFTCWTCKEAYVKAKGVGLSLGLDLFDAIPIYEDPGFLLTYWDAAETISWTVQTIDINPHYVAALAVEGDQCQLGYWQIDERFLDKLCVL